MKDCLKPQKCDCGKKASRDLIAEHADGGVDSQMREYEFYGENGTRMYGAAYLDNQIEDARKKHPGTDFIWHNKCWLPRIKNRQHKLKYMKEYDPSFVEYS